MPVSLVIGTVGDLKGTGVNQCKPELAFIRHLPGGVGAYIGWLVVVIGVIGVIELQYRITNF